LFSSSIPTYPWHPWLPLAANVLTSRTNSIILFVYPLQVVMMGESGNAPRVVVVVVRGHASMTLFDRTDSDTDTDAMTGGLVVSTDDVDVKLPIE